MKRAASPTSGSRNRKDKGKQRRLDDQTTISTGTSSTFPSASTYSQVPTSPSFSSSSVAVSAASTSASTSAPDGQQQKYHKACGQYGHSRTSSKLCPLYKPPHGKAPPPPLKLLPDEPARKSAVPGGEPGDEPPVPPPDAQPDNEGIRGKWIEEHKVYKCGFRNILNTPPLENMVNNVVTHITKACYQMSRLLQLHVQRIIEENLEFPNMKPTWIRHLFQQVQNTFPARSYEITTAPISSQVLTYVTQSYATLLNSHVETHYGSMSKLWVKQCLMHRGLPETQARRLSIEIWDCCAGQDDGNEDGAEEIAAFRQEWQQYVIPISESNTTVPSKLQRMYRLNILFTA
ncbi:unnamed protein product [Umbelopsis ramanniana]